MASRHNHAPWRKLVLVPLWAVQLLFLIVMIGALAILLSALSTRDAEQIDWKFNTIVLSDEVVNRTLHIIVLISLIICSVCLVLTVTEIILFSKRNLRPLVYIILNVVKAGTWTALFVMEMISISRIDIQRSNVVGIVIDVIPLLAFWIPLIYGVIVWRKSTNVKGVYIPVATPMATEAYPSQYKHFISEETIAVEPTRPAGARRLSYNHTRDTRFERFSYGRRSLSNPDIKLGNDVVIIGNGSVPSVTIEDHDLDAFEMDRPRHGSK